MTDRAPLVSVVIPSYNAARTVRATIESALGQSVTDMEVTVVDDGSADETVAIAEAVADPRVKVVRQRNAGAAAARNTGVELASGKWVALLDADDLWLPDKLERQLAALDANPGSLAVCSGAYMVDDDLRVISVRRYRQREDPLLAFLRFQNPPAAMSDWVVARSAFDEMGMFDCSLEILEEWDMCIKIARHCKPVSIPDALSLYRQHPGNRSRDLDIHIEPGFKVLGELFADPDLPRHIRKREREIYARFYTMLSGGAFKVGRWRECARWGSKALLTDPRMLGYIAALPIRRLRRNASRVGAAAEPYPTGSSGLA